MTTFQISQHAVDKYRDRVIQCCERVRDHDAIRSAMTEQLLALPWRLAGGDTFIAEGGLMRPSCKRTGDWVVEAVTHTFVIEQSVVVTVLGFGMRTDRRRNRKKRRRKANRRAWRAYAARMEAANSPIAKPREP